MEPIDTDMDYTAAPGAPTPGSRLNALLIFPILGFLLLLIFAAAAIFQFNLSDLIDSLMGLMMLLFILLIAMLFWALAPMVRQSHH
jgi:hypothetical protein